MSQINNVILGCDNKLAKLATVGQNNIVALEGGPVAAE